ncbi:hypothetical protein IFM89_005747 [Coptis chinensis]|uniref:COBRA-like protein n=1 Tax=Coptis chinensis TaxID=261450 RepID=A0A835M4D3_9MAGN|nr:hypothetical protein IFM89_005747 [Coptis chinensis]
MGLAMQSGHYLLVHIAMILWIQMGISQLLLTSINGQQMGIWNSSDIVSKCLQARVTIQNYYQYRHVDKPGWQLGWTWASNEIIWSMNGAFATRQGNCSSFKEDPIPHSCQRNPVIADLTPEAPGESQSENCCHDGLLSAWAIEPSKSFSSFEIKVGNLNNNSSGFMPQNLTIMAPGPGYTCGPLADFKPTIYPVIGGRREQQAFIRLLLHAPLALADAKLRATVFLHALGMVFSFRSVLAYNSNGNISLISSCAVSFCQDFSLLQADPTNLENRMMCTDHMCPIRVHWHVKINYRDNWRIKLTVSNYNYGRNYSSWNLVVQHPGLSMSPSVYSFNSTLLQTYGFADEVALFWGLSSVNEMLLQASDVQEGSVSTEILMGKKAELFTFSNGWALPRTIYFNGENCQMPPPDSFPMLPNSSCNWQPSSYPFHLLIALIYLTLNK